MDSDQQTSIAQQQDPELAARIVRSIEQLERDYRFAWGPLSERFVREAAGIMRRAAPEPWVVDGDEWGVALLAPDWKPNKGLGRGDAYFELADIIGGEVEHSWIAVAVGAGSTKLCLELKFRPALAPLAQALTTKDKPVANLLKAGLELDQSGERLFVGVPLDAEALARGFELNDLDEALAPLRTATELAIRAKPDLDVLIEFVRSTAKRK